MTGFTVPTYCSVGYLFTWWVCVIVLAVAVLGATLVSYCMCTTRGYLVNNDQWRLHDYTGIYGGIGVLCYSHCETCLL